MTVNSVSHTNAATYIVALGGCPGNPEECPTVNSSEISPEEWH